MTNFKEGTDRENRSDPPQASIYAPDHQMAASDPTSQRIVSPRIEITITRQQLIAATRLFKEYGEPKPGWLRQRFYINQRRRKCLNTQLIEAQLDRVYCGRYHNPEDWDGLLHLMWHMINGEPLCR